MLHWQQYLDVCCQYLGWRLKITLQHSTYSAASECANCVDHYIALHITLHHKLADYTTWGAALEIE